jgi:hypothetical protein
MWRASSRAWKSTPPGASRGLRRQVRAPDVHGHWASWVKAPDELGGAHHVITLRTGDTVPGDLVDASATPATLTRARYALSPRNREREVQQPRRAAPATTVASATAAPVPVPTPSAPRRAILGANAAERRPGGRPRRPRPAALRTRTLTVTTGCPRTSRVTTPGASSSLPERRRTVTSRLMPPKLNQLRSHQLVRQNRPRGHRQTSDAQFDRDAAGSVPLSPARGGLVVHGSRRVWVRNSPS